MTFFSALKTIAPTKKQLSQNQTKLENAIQQMGNKWRLHPDNYVQKLKAPFTGMWKEG